ELKVGITTDLLRQQAQGRTDVVFGKQCRRVGDDGELLWEEPLVWAAATAIELPAGEPLPLALFPEPCVYREAAITALGAAARPWRLVFESASMAGCLSAALAGFAVTVVARSQMREGLRELGPEQGFPTLPEARFYAFSRQPSLAADALIEAVRQLGQRSRFVTAQG
ncbi:LysR substrate-binding domain-containing protein, partial [Pseudomonas aeruginosa]